MSFMFDVMTGMAVSFTYSAVTCQLPLRDFEFVQAVKISVRITINKSFVCFI